MLYIDSDVFSNNIEMKIQNDLKNKIFKQEIFFSNLNSHVLNNFSYIDKIKTGILSENTFGKENKIFYEFNDKFLNFRSEKKINNKYLFQGSIILDPFDLTIEINLNKIDLNDLISLDSFLINVINSNLILNKKLNYNISLFAKKISNHRKLKNLNLFINFVQQDFSLKKSNIVFEDIFNISILENEIQDEEDKKLLTANLLFQVLDKDKMYRFFQTKKNDRKKIDSIEMRVKFNLLNGLLQIENLKIDGKLNQNFSSLINEFNLDKDFLMRQVIIKKYFNKMISRYEG